MKKALKLSDAGLRLIRELEGCRLTAYRCPAGRWTIGVGHTKTAKPGMTITSDQAMILLRQDVLAFERTVNVLVHVPLSQTQFDALVSLAFNIGSSAFERSTLVKLLNEFDYRGAAEQFARWRFVGGRESQGLARRRSIEKSLFLREAAV